MPGVGRGRLCRITPCAQWRIQSNTTPLTVHTVCQIKCSLGHLQLDLPISYNIAPSQNVLAIRFNLGDNPTFVLPRWLEIDWTFHRLIYLFRREKHGRLCADRPG